jgi:hypothetical protein
MAYTTNTLSYLGGGLVDRFCPDKSVAATGHRNNVALPAGTFVQRLSQGRYVDVDVAVIDDQPRPNLRHQVVLGNHLALCRDQNAKNVEHPAADMHQGLIAPQLSPPKIKSKAAESDLVAIHGSLP